MERGEEAISQARAREALALGIEIDGDGYNLFVVGPAGLGKHRLTSALVSERAKSQPKASDWCYVHNFRQPHEPNALRLPAGMGSNLRDQMRQFVEDLRTLIPALFDSEGYLSRFGALLTDFNLIRAGALHRANDCYLLLDARKVLSQPLARRRRARMHAGNGCACIA